MALDKLTKVQSVGISSFIQVVGVVTATGGFVGDLTGNVTGTTSNASGATGDFSIADKIVHTGDTNTAIRFPAADTITAETGGSERLRIKSDGDVYIGNIAHSNDGGVNSSYRTLTLTDTTNGAQLHLRGQSPKLYLDVTSGGNGEIYYDTGDLRILSGEPGSAGSTERLRIDSAGTVIVGTDTTVNPILRILGTSAHNSFIQFADGDSNNVGQLQYSHSSNALIVAVNGGEKLRLDSAGRMLLGTTNAGSNGTADDLVVANNSSASDQAGITIRGGTSGRSQIFFSDGTSGQDEYRGMLRYDHSDNSMQFRTNAVEKLRIDSGGTVHVNSPDTASGGRIYATGSKLYLQSGNGRQSFNIADMAPGQSATHEFNSSGNLVFASGNGIDFSATSDASGMTSELLDDYEEGTWTPQLLGGSSNPSLTYSSQSGGYEKIGNLVHLSFFMNVSAVNSQGSGYLELHGLPYTPVTSPLGASEVPALVLQTQPFADGKAANRFAFVRTVGGSSRMFVGYRDLTNGNAIIPSQGAGNISTGYFIGHITYRAS